MPTQPNAPITARQLSQATMHFDGLQLDHQLPRRSSMPGQLNLVIPPRSAPLNILVNAPLPHNPQHAHINVPAPPSPVLNPAPLHFPLIPPAFRFPPSPPQALPLHAPNPMANNVTPICYPILRLHHSFPPQTFLYPKYFIHRPHKKFPSPKFLSL